MGHRFCLRDQSIHFPRGDESGIRPRRKMGIGTSQGCRETLPEPQGRLRSFGCTARTSMHRRNPPWTTSNLGTACPSNIRWAGKAQVGIWRRSGGSAYLVDIHSARRDHPSCTPSKCRLPFRRPHCKLQFKILNFSNSVLHWPIVLGIAPWLVKIEPVPNLIELERILRSNSGYAVTHTGIVEREDGQGFTQEEAQALLNGLDNFLSFICSSSSAVTDVTGVGTDGNDVWKRWGSHHVAPWARRRTWADDTVRSSLPDIFRNFWQEYSKSNEDLERVLGWYVYSNQSEALDVSIIFNHAVLQLLTYITAGQKPPKTKTGDWIADNLRNEGIDPQIPPSCRSLSALANQRSLRHGPHALVDIRNSMIHPNPTFCHPSIDASHDAKQLGLWYIELMLLKRFQYMGEYASRLTPVHTLGDTEPVPWP